MGTKVCTLGLGRMTKMADMPIYKRQIDFVIHQHFNLTVPLINHWAGCSYVSYRISFRPVKFIQTVLVILTKMAAMPMYGKSPLRLLTLKLCVKHWGFTNVFQTDPALTLTLCMSRSTFVPIIWKIDNSLDFALTN